MKIVNGTLAPFELQYPPEQIAPLKDILFLDIETTGFSAKSSYVYLIGCVYHSEGGFMTIQWLAENYDEEQEIISEFIQFSGRFSCLIHYNGSTFDLPFLQHKCQQYGLSDPFEHMQSVDLFKMISHCKFLLKLPNCKQKTVEQFLGINREDTFSGGELISMYHEYVKSPSRTAMGAILLHNKEDLTGMLQLLPVLAYYDLFAKDIRIKKVQANYYRDLSGSTRMELLMTVSFPFPLPRPVSASANNCYFSGEGLTGTIKVPVYEEEMKYFYSNYKDYYYLPTEDVALHKSVATFVDSEHRLPATASTCYTRKISQYLPQFGMFREPFFKRDYKSKELFFELTPELKTDREAFSAYANHILAMIATVY